MNKNLFLSIIFSLLVIIFTSQTFGSEKSKTRSSQLLQKTQNQGQIQVQDLNLEQSQNTITLNYRDMNIRDAFSALAMEFKINLVMSNDVQGSITLHLFNLTLEEALSTIAMAGGYDYKKTGTMHHIFKGIKQNKKQSIPIETHMRVLKTNFVAVDKVKETLNAVPGLNPIEIHESTKTIIVNDTLENIEKIEKILSSLDSVPKQVLIEAKILKVNLTDEMSLGVDWKAIMTDGIIQTQGFSNAVLPDGSPVPSPASQGGTGGFINFVAGVGSSVQIAAALDALESETNVDIVATPKVLAINGKEAKVQVGGQQGYRVTTTIDNVTTESIEFIDTGTILEITPYIDEENNILLNVKPSLSSADITPITGIPTVTSTSVSTWLLSKDGDTAFIAGLIESIDIKKEEGVPLLSDIPILGNLFGRTEDSTFKSELVILITTKIVTQHLTPTLE